MNFPKEYCLETVNYLSYEILLLEHFGIEGMLNNLQDVLVNNVPQLKKFYFYFQAKRCLMLEFPSCS